MPLGSAVLTGPGKLSCPGIIHVAGINMLWIATPVPVMKSVHSAVKIVNGEGFASVAFPIIGGGTGGRTQKEVLACMLAAFAEIKSSAKVTVVRFAPKSMR